VAINATTPNKLIQAIAAQASGNQAGFDNTRHPVADKPEVSDLLMGDFGKSRGR